MSRRAILPLAVGPSRIPTCPLTRLSGYLLALFTLSLPALADDVVEVNVSGAGKSLTRNVLAHLDLGEVSCTVTELQLRKQLGDADEKISAALRAMGYYQGQWSVNQHRTEEKNGGCPVVDVAITPGPPTLIDTVHIELLGDGSDNPQLTKAVAKVPLKEGKRLNHANYETAKKLIRQAALSQGYFDATFTSHRLDVDRTANRAGITLVFDTGPRYHFGEIRISDDHFDNSFFDSYLPFASGDAFDAGKLITLQNNLLNSRYFSTVDVDQYDPDKSAHTVDVDLNLTVKSKYESIVGAGFSTDLGPKLNYELRNRRFNRDGDTYVLSTQYSPVLSNAGLQYQQPGSDPINEKTLWSLGWKQEDNDSFKSISYNADVSRVRLLGSGWVRTASLSLLMEDFNVGVDDDNVILLYPGLSMQKSRANNPIYPTRGWRISSGVRGGAEQALSSTSFIQTTLDGKLILPLAGGRVISRAGIGATFVRDFSKLPASLRFFAGGDNSVRGYGYETLGPSDDEGDIAGGKYLITGSLEYDHKVYKEYSGALFYDAGNAFDNQEFEIFDSAGVGVRWHSPIGTIRVDFAIPLDKDGFQVHLSMGPDL